MTIRVYEDAAALAAAAAHEVASLGVEAIAARGRFLLALSGGSTPRAMHAHLVRPDLQPPLAWDTVEFFWSDERSVPPDHPDSNFGMARATLLDPLHIAEARIHRMEGERADLDAAAKDYERTLASVTGTPLGGPPPALDLVLLGMGPDGHTASLFPRTRALDVVGRWVVTNDVPRLETRRLTFTFELIEVARAVRVLVAGADKAETLAAVLTGPRRPADLPAQELLDSETVWLVDRAAAARLPAGITE